MSSNQVLYPSTDQNDQSESQYSETNILEPKIHISLRSGQLFENSEAEKSIDSDDPNTNSDDPNTNSDKQEIILCILWQSGMLGAAYYNSADSELYILHDTLDLSPEFIMMKKLYSQLKPNYTITQGTRKSKLVSALSLVALHSDLEVSEGSSSAQESTGSLPPNIQLLKIDEYSYELCRHAVETLRLPSEPADIKDEERLTYVNSIVNFDKQVTVHALGALLLFLNKNRGIIAPCSDDSPNHLFLNISIVSVENILLIDHITCRALNIFNPVVHIATFKRPKQSSSSEGLSIFTLFNRCRSNLGRSHLRAMLLQPTNDINVLKKRQNFIEFCLKPINNGIVTGIKECLKNIFSITPTLRKIHGNQALISNWKTLYLTLHHILLIQQICKPHANEIKLFQELNDQIDDIIEIIIQVITQVIDFDNSHRNRVSVKIGVDEELDTKKRYKSEIKEKITLAAMYEIHNLPPYINNCSMVYIPKIGYLVVVNKWSNDANFTDMEQYGFRYMFTLGDMLNFKSAVCDELDRCLGDIYTEIEEHELEIIVRLGENILVHSAALKKPLKTIGLFDCLISMADVAKELGYVKPNIVSENVIDIQDGKHPLLDLTISNFVPNTFTSGYGQGKSLVKIITGPNNGGKTIYLTQTALIVYLAHIGSFVPAQSATIGVMYSIYSDKGGHSRRTKSLYNSAFGLELRQMSEAVSCPKKNSLVLIDEFGQSTTELDGLALLTSYLEHFLLKERFCPHILCSTHYFHLTNLIPESNMVEHLKSVHKFDGNKLVLLYKIVKGVSYSYGKYTMRAFGLPESIIQRSEEILKCYREGKPLTPISKI